MSSWFPSIMIEMIDSPSLFVSNDCIFVEALIKRQGKTDNNVISRVHGLYNAGFPSYTVGIFLSDWHSSFFRL